MKKLEKLYKETTENNEMMEEATMVHREVTKKMEEAMKEQMRISSDIAEPRLELGDRGGEYDNEDEAVADHETLITPSHAGPRQPWRRSWGFEIGATTHEARWRMHL